MKDDKIGPHTTDFKSGKQQEAFHWYAESKGFRAEMKGMLWVTVWCTLKQYIALLDGFGVPARRRDKNLGYKQEKE